MREKPYVNSRSKQILREAQERREKEETREWIIQKVQEKDRVRTHRKKSRKRSIESTVSDGSVPS